MGLGHSLLSRLTRSQLKLLLDIPAGRSNELFRFDLASQQWIQLGDNKSPVSGDESGKISEGCARRAVLCEAALLLLRFLMSLNLAEPPRRSGRVPTPYCDTGKCPFGQGI